MIEVALESLKTSGRLRLQVTGNSMLPSICSGSVATIIRQDSDSVQPGTIVLVRTGDGVRLHRLVALHPAADRTMAVTRGDNNDDDDLPVAGDALLGVLAGLEPPSLPRRWFSRAKAWFQMQRPA